MSERRGPLQGIAETVAALMKGRRTRAELMDMVDVSAPSVLSAHLAALMDAGVVLNVGKRMTPGLTGAPPEEFELAPWPYEARLAPMEHPERVVYLAGPMTGLPDLNYPAFNAIATLLRANGWTVHNPAENPAPPCGTWRGYMRLALAQIAQVDYVAMLPRWERSRWARIEYQLARDLGLRVVMVEELLGVRG